MKNIQELITNETNKLLSTSLTKQTLNDFISNIDNKLTNTLQTSQNLISSTEQRLDTSIREFKFSAENQLNFLDNQKDRLTVNQGLHSEKEL
jgi:hypothetical protein